MIGSADKNEIVRLFRNASDFESKGKLKEAIAELETAITMNPADGNIYNRLGDLYVKNGKIPEAVSTYRRGIVAYRNDTFYRNSLALCKKILKYDPGHIEIYFVIGELLVSLDERTEAFYYLFEYVEKLKPQKQVAEIVKTLDYIRDLGVKDPRIIDRLVANYRAADRSDRAELMINPEAPAEPKAEEVKLIYDRTIKVLLIEDDEDDYLITKKMLAEIKDIRFDLQWKSAYAIGLEAIVKNEYDIVLLDYQLGEKNGLELLREAGEKGCVLPVILLTGFGGREVDLEAMRAGAVDYLIKGRVDANTLDRSIRYAIERNRLVHALRESKEQYRSQVLKAMSLLNALNESQEKLRTQAIRDDLTGLFNRRHFMDIMGMAVSSAQRHSHSLSLCICDLDGFKEINDRYGHQLGDEVLKTFAAIITENLRLETAAGRYGGDELCLLFPLANAEEVVKAIERIRTQLGQTHFTAENGEKFEVQATFGVAELSGTMGQTDLFKLADQALYEAKAAGKNQIAIKK
jgi:two-component system cell cycle response regulator